MRGLPGVASILLVDWPSREVPESLTRAGYRVTLKGAPGEGEYSGYEIANGHVRVRRMQTRPVDVDLVYVHRPLDELPGILEMARDLGAHTLWYQSGVDDTGARDSRGCWVPPGESDRARALVEASGLRYSDHAYIADSIGDDPAGS
jgi:hypothetical protein